MSASHTITVDSSVTLEQMQEALHTAMVVAGALHGTPSVMLARPRIDADRWCIEIDRGLDVAECLACALVGLLINRHGMCAVRTDPVTEVTA
ncbi:MAG: hypothetical protein JNM94_15395 [Phycisphaerae bacterium]|nr:hypothetical protein [Phycisphaerae bacterium]